MGQARWPTMAPTWPQPLKVHQHPVGRAGVDAQRGGALKRDVTWDCDELFLAEHSLGPPGSWGKARGVRKDPSMPNPSSPSSVDGRRGQRASGMLGGKKRNPEVFLNVFEAW